MPIYEYRRLTDGKIIEVQQSIKDDALEKCPETGDPVKKIISRTSFQLKGGGWYTTDYKDSPAPKTEAKSSDNSEKLESSDKTETKPATDAASKTPAPKTGPDKKEPAKKEAAPAQAKGPS